MGALPARAGSILEAVLYRGELPRGEVAAVLCLASATGRRGARLQPRQSVAYSSPRLRARLYTSHSRPRSRVDGCQVCFRKRPLEVVYAVGRLPRGT
jgi:hypothetical protein